MIEVRCAHAHNLKNISLSIPHNTITGVTGVSGAGKSTLLRKVLGSYGTLNFVRLRNKTVRDALTIDEVVDVDAIENLPQTLLIEVTNYITNPASTLSTVSGIHQVLRDVFTNAAKVRCLACGKEVPADLFSVFDEYVEFAEVDVLYDKSYHEVVDCLSSSGQVLGEAFFDRNGDVAKNTRARSLATVTAALPAVSEPFLRDLRLRHKAAVRFKVRGLDACLDPLQQTICPGCLSISPRLSRSRFSFNVDYDDGGGKCRRCAGTGMTLSIPSEHLIADKNKPILQGGLNFVHSSGIKYTKITEKFLRAFCKQHGIPIDTPVGRLGKKRLDLLLHGADTAIAFKDRVGGMKELPFRGVADYLTEAYRKGRRQKALAAVITEAPCPRCGNTRIDPAVDAFEIGNVVLRDLLGMSLDELLEWTRNSLGDLRFARIRGSLHKLVRMLETYEKLACLHLGLYRSSSTLSGGELQRVRLCAMVNANIRHICYLLNEPTSGLHHHDVGRLAELFVSIRNRDNTLILVDHSKRLLAECEHLVELGPGGGPDGGQVVFSAPLADIGSYETPTALYLRGDSISAKARKENRPEVGDGTGALALVLDDLCLNNLQHVSASIPYNSVTTVCGVSGSGKSSFLKAVAGRVALSETALGFSNVIYLKQRGLQVRGSASVGNLLRVVQSVAKAFATKSGIDGKHFLPSSRLGKCRFCEGRGYLAGAQRERLSLCPRCGGRCFDEDTLAYKSAGMNIDDVLNTSVSDFSRVAITEDLTRIATICAQLGIGHVSLSRKLETLSKGERQRVLLVRLLAQSEPGTLCFLDEPSKGLHHEDVLKLSRVLKELAGSGTTVLAVEHNPTMIRESDHTIEFGPGAGADGGQVIFSGSPLLMKGTPTADALRAETCRLPTRAEHPRQTKNDCFFVTRESVRTELNRHAINRLADDADTLARAFRKAEEAFLDASITGGRPMHEEAIQDPLEIDMPLASVVDFGAPRVGSKVSVYNALNISSSLIRGFTADADAREAELLKCVFSDTSDVGKCIRCRGQGRRATLPRQLFMEGNELSRKAARFLANSTNFKEARAAVLSDSGLDMGIPISRMTKREGEALFDGLADMVDGNSAAFVEWKGLFDHAIANYRHYPDKEAGKRFPAQKRSVVCRFCGGGLLQEQFAKKTYCGLAFSEWMMRPTRQIVASLGQKGLDGNRERILRTLTMLHNLCDEELRLHDDLGALDGATRGLVRLVSLFRNNVYGTIIAMRNLERLSPEQRKRVRGIASSWKRSNTIVELT